MLTFVVTQNVKAQEQTNYIKGYNTYNQAILLYEDEHYELAQITFDELAMENADTELKSNSAYYSAKCALVLNHNNAVQKMVRFAKEYPTSSKVVAAYMDLATYYFNEGEFEKSFEYSRKINPLVLSEEQKQQLEFQEGYAAFKLENYSQAKKSFKSIEPLSKFHNQATYYLGYIYYLENNFEEAKKYFSDIDSIEKYQEKMGYYNADMYFKTGAFDKAIEEGIKQLPKANAQEKSELSKIIGESYFNLKQYVNALPYLLDYDGKDGKLSNTDYYQLGYTYYKLNDPQRAISYFNQIINGEDEVAQNAYYHLGECYLISGLKNQAFHAFKNASEMSYNSQIQEDAYANYAKLSYDIGNPYQHISEVLENFLSKYPNSSHTKELEELLVDSYVTTRDFKQALEILEKHKSLINKPIYQKVLFYRGIEELKKGRNLEAIRLLDQSISERQSNIYMARAMYWKAEALFAMGDHTKALQTIDTFEHLPQYKQTPEFDDLNYFKGYLYSNSKAYNDAVSAFQSFLASTNNKNKKMDAELRLADVYFAKGDFNQAIKQYNTIENNNPSVADYVAYQKALSYGLINQNGNKIKELLRFEKLYSKSKFLDAALYELGKTYSNMGDDQSAIEAYARLSKNFDSSPYLSKSLLNEGLAYYKTHNREKAIELFRQVVEKYPNTQEALQAVQNARIAYNEMGQTALFADWVKSLDFIDISTAELEQDAYQVADQYRAKGENNEAMKAFENYLKQYPNGTFAMASHYYLAQLNEKSNKELAIKHYEQVVKMPKGEYTEPSLVWLANEMLNKNAIGKAETYLKQLKTIAVRNQNKEFALSNLMKLTYEQNNISAAVGYAHELEAMSNISNKAKIDLLVILGRNSINSGNTKDAKKYFGELKGIAKGEAAAEALYYQAYFESLDKKYDQSNKTIQKIAKDFPQYQYFGAKSLVLMAQNYYALNDAYQATYILENVIKNFDFADVNNEATNLLNTYKKQQSKKNSSIK